MTANRIRAWAWAFAILAVSACQSTPLDTIEPTVPEIAPSSPEALLQQARLAAGREAARLYLSATESLIRASRLDEAAASFREIDQALLSGARAADYGFAAAEIALHEGDPVRAAALLAAARPRSGSTRAARFVDGNAARPHLPRRRR